MLFISLKVTLKVTLNQQLHIMGISSRTLCEKYGKDYLGWSPLSLSSLHLGERCKNVPSMQQEFTTTIARSNSLWTEPKFTRKIHSTCFQVYYVADVPDVPVPLLLKTLSHGSWSAAPLIKRGTILISVSTKLTWPVHPYIGAILSYRCNQPQVGPSHFLNNILPCSEVGFDFIHMVSIVKLLSKYQIHAKAWSFFLPHFLAIELEFQLTLCWLCPQWFRKNLIGRLMRCR